MKFYMKLTGVMEASDSFNEALVYFLGIIAVLLSLLVPGVAYLSENATVSALAIFYVKASAFFVLGVPLLLAVIHTATRYLSKGITDGDHEVFLLDYFIPENSYAARKSDRSFDVIISMMGVHSWICLAAVFSYVFPVFLSITIITLLLGTGLYKSAKGIYRLNKTLREHKNDPNAHSRRD